MSEKSKLQRCRHCFPSLDGGYKCLSGTVSNDERSVNESDCEECPDFSSKYIEYPITVNKINTQKIDTSGVYESGSLCEVQPCAEEYAGKSYLGFYLGDLPIGIVTSYRRDTCEINISTMNNPAIFVPELGKIIYGCESFWREIEDVSDFKGISEEEIQNTWYVKAVKEMFKGRKKKDSERSNS